MARRARLSILEDLIELPWWVSVATALSAYLIISLGVPAMLSRSAVAEGLARAANEHAWMFSLVLLVPAPFAALREYRRRKLLDAHADLNGIRGLGWQEFEKLVAEAFHRQGYWVAEKGGANADGGIDLVLKRGAERVLVQCKHWRARAVGVAPVRELFGVMTAEGATRAVLVTSGSFSAEAYAFAARKPLQLLDGPLLEKLIATVRSDASGAVESLPSALSCPECGARMIKRTARKGIMAGSAFWGCTHFPTCRGIRPAS